MIILWYIIMAKNSDTCKWDQFLIFGETPAKLVFPLKQGKVNFRYVIGEKGKYCVNLVVSLISEVFK